MLSLLHHAQIIILEELNSRLKDTDLNCSRQIVGSPKTNNFGDDSTYMRFSSLREAQLKEMLSDIPLHLRPKLDRWLRIVVKEEVELAHKSHATTSMHGEGDSESRSLELRFSNDIVSTLLTGHVLEAVGGVPLEVILVDSCTKEVVKSGDEASGGVEIVVLEDGVTGGEDVKSNEILVLKMEGSKSRRVGSSLCLNLMQGSAILPMVSFLRNGVYMKNSKLRLGAKFVSNCNNGVRVKEAKTGPFLLKDLRNDAYTKRPIPSLHDHVWRLYKVDKKGSLAKNMRHAEIITVGDFLVHLFRQTQCLKEIFDHSNHSKSWKTTVNHARKCPAKLKYCSSFDPKTEVVFNVSGEVVGLSQDNRFLSSDKLSETQKEDAKNLVISAFDNWKDVVHVEEDQKPNHASYNSHGHHQLPKTEPVTPRTFCKNVVLDDLELKIDETCLFGDMNISDGKPPNPELLPGSLRQKYDEIYHGFESVCNIPNPIQPEGAQRNRLCNTWKILFCVVTFKIRSLTKNDLDDIRAHKKSRMCL